MDRIDANQVLESKFNMCSDNDILLLLTGEKLSAEEKKYLLEHCQNRIEQMNMDIFLLALKQTDRDFCEKCNQYLASKIPSLTVAQIEELLYENTHYHELSEIASFLVKQDWFQMKRENEYKAFFIAFELEAMLNMKLVSKEKIIDIGADIISLLTSINGNFKLFDMITKNYLSLLEKYDPQYFVNFKEQGYEIIDLQIACDKELTPNMIIFDCGITKKEVNANVDYFEFYEKDEGSEGEAFAYHHSGKVRINLAAIKDIYKQYEKKKKGTQMLLYIIGHEIDHVYCERYKSTENNDLKEELRVFNSRISFALQHTVSRDFYREYHNCFSHEFSANIKGIENLYYKQKYLPCITNEDKEEMNRLLASILFLSYCMEEDDFNKSGYVGPVEFSREEFENFKDCLPGVACHALLNNQKVLPKELEMIETNLNEMEKFLLGYYNQYIVILKLIAKGKVKSVNLFDDLPSLYDKYKDLIGEEFPPYFITSKASDIKRI